MLGEDGLKLGEDGLKLSDSENYIRNSKYKPFTSELLKLKF